MNFIILSSLTPKFRISWTGISPASANIRGSIKSLPEKKKTEKCGDLSSNLKIYIINFCVKTAKTMCIPSSVVEFVLSSQMASLMRGGANAAPS